MAWEITGGVANQPGTPEVRFGFGRNDGWFEASLEDDSDFYVISTTNTFEQDNLDRRSLITDAGELGERRFFDVNIFPRPLTEGIPEISVVSGGGAVEVDPNVSFGVRTNPGGDGVPAVVRLSTPSRTLDFDVTGNIETSGASSDSLIEFFPGTVAGHANDNVLNRVAGADLSMLPIFTDYAASNVSGSYTRNPDCWCYDIRASMTCISPWNFNGGNLKSGVAITPRHVLFVKHAGFTPPEGTTIRFVTADDQTVTRSVLDRIIADNDDLGMVFLDSDLPSSITPCKFLPTDYENYFPTGGKWIGALALDKQERATVVDNWVLGGTGGRWTSYIKPEIVDKITLYRDKGGGDSGNPVFFIINGNFVLLALLAFGGSGAGSFLTSKIGVLNQMIAKLDSRNGVNTGYTLSTVDLSGFTNFA